MEEEVEVLLESVALDDVGVVTGSGPELVVEEEEPVRGCSHGWNSHGFGVERALLCRWLRFYGRYVPWRVIPWQAGAALPMDEPGRRPSGQERPPGTPFRPHRAKNARRGPPSDPIGRKPPAGDPPSDPIGRKPPAGDPPSPYFHFSLVNSFRMCWLTGEGCFHSAHSKRVTAMIFSPLKLRA